MKQFLLAASAVLLGVQLASAGGRPGVEKLLEQSPVPVPSGVSLDAIETPPVTGAPVSSLQAGLPFPVGINPALQCRKIRCYDVEKPVNAPTWCSGDFWSSITLTRQGDRVQLSADGGVNEGSLRKDHDTVIADFSDGDQSSVFSCAKDDLVKLFSKQKSEIPVTYADGFDWADGSHVRYKIEFLCRL